LNLNDLSIAIIDIMDNYRIFLQNLPGLIIGILSELFPFLLNIAIVVVNLSLITGAILYLLEDNEENGKKMIKRSLITCAIIFLIFTPYSSNSISITEPFEGFQFFTSFITSYLLFVFAALSLILFISNLGLYLLSANKNTTNHLKKSFFCLICVILPLGFQFPNMPLLKV
jgi:hypothetical protein